MRWLSLRKISRFIHSSTGDDKKREGSGGSLRGRSQDSFLPVQLEMIRREKDESSVLAVYEQEGKNYS